MGRRYGGPQAFLDDPCNPFHSSLGEGATTSSRDEFCCYSARGSRFCVWSFGVISHVFNKPSGIFIPQPLSRN